MSLPDAEWQQARQNLDLLCTHSGIHRQAAENLRTESNLTSADLQRLAATLAVPYPSTDSLVTALTLLFRDLTFHGPEADSGGVVFLRMVSTDVLAKHFADCGYFGSQFSARRSIRNGTRTAKTCRLKWTTYTLGKFLMWATFCPTAAANPRSGLPASKRDLMCVLGLSHLDRRKSMLIIQYRLPGTTKAQVPTVAEAYSASEWHPYFRPAPPGRRHGLTQPWPECAKLGPRPEVIHSVIAGNCIMDQDDCVQELP